MKKTKRAMIPIFGPQGVPPGWVDEAETKRLAIRTDSWVLMPIFGPRGAPQAWVEQGRPNSGRAGS